MSVLPFGEKSSQIFGLSATYRTKIVKASSTCKMTEFTQSGPDQEFYDITLTGLLGFDLIVPQFIIILLPG